MSFRHFPPPKDANNMQSGARCGNHACDGIMEPWDCGCSFGCDLCWATLCCPKCARKGGGGGSRNRGRIKVYGSTPARPKTPCPQCGKPVGNVDAHIKDVHKPAKTRCPICGVNKRNIQDHVRDVHSGKAAPSPKALDPGHDLTCPECGKGPMKLRRSRFGLFYGCTQWPDCTGTHGAHLDGTPLGTPADKETRQFRRIAHDLFDELWKPGKGQVFKSRPEGYVWIQQVMGLSAKNAHIGKFDKDQCKKLIEAVWDLDATNTPLARRKP